MNKTFFNFIKIITIALAALLQASFLQFIPILNYINLFAMVAILMSLFKLDIPTKLTIVISGLCLESFSSAPFGLLTLTLFIIIWLSRTLFEKMFSEKSLLSVFVYSVLVNLIYKILISTIEIVVTVFIFKLSLNSFVNLPSQLLTGVLVNSVLFFILLIIKFSFSKATYKFISTPSF